MVTKLLQQPTKLNISTKHKIIHNVVNWIKDLYTFRVDTSENEIAKLLLYTNTKYTDVPKFMGNSVLR